MESDLDIAENKLTILVESYTMSPDYNPFLEYFQNLTPWDKKTNHIKEMADTVKVSKQKHFEEVLVKYLVGTLDCLIGVNTVNDVCLVFQSGQGFGKTRWMRKLLPKEFRDEYLYEGSIDTRNKDHSEYLSNYWFIHLDELETLKSNEIGPLKSFITQEKIAHRKAYGRYKTSFVRRASFLGSVNEDKFLSDTTGNRRWLVFKLKSIDYLHELDVDKMWAQVFHLWKEKFRHWFDTDEIKAINDTNEQFRSMSTDEEMLLKCFEFINVKDDSSGEYYSSTEALIDIGTERPAIMSKLNSRVMGKAMSKHIEEKNRKVSSGVTKYYMKKILTPKEDHKPPTEEESTDINEVMAESSNPENNSEDYEVPF